MGIFNHKTLGAVSVDDSERKNASMKIASLTIHTSIIAGTGFRFASAAKNERDAKIDKHIALTETPEFKKPYRDTILKAWKYIRQQHKSGQQGFVIFDIDEVTLDNRGYFADPKSIYYKKAPGLQSIKETWAKWVQQSFCPAIPITKRLINYLNAKGIYYCFLTGIDEDLKPHSVKNLQQTGVIGPSCLGAFYKPTSWQGSTRAFKKEKRHELEKQFGLSVMASIGDRPGDMTDNPEKNFLLPCYVKKLREENDN